MAKGTEANLSSDKLLRIVEHMSAQRLPMRLKDIAENLNISQPTVLRYLRTMCEQGQANRPLCADLEDLPSGQLPGEQSGNAQYGGNAAQRICKPV